jgi:hypothetical protein
MSRSGTGHAMRARAVVAGLLALSVAATAHGQRRGNADRAAQARPPSAPDAGAPRASTGISSIEVVVMAGSHGAGGIAQELRGYSQLSRPPFSAFSQIELVSQRQLPLGEQTPGTIAIPNDGTIRVSLGAARGRRSSVLVTITLGGRTHQSQYSVVAGDPFFLVHSTGVDSALIVRFVAR